MREIGVQIHTISSLSEIEQGNLLIQHEFALFDNV